MSCALGPYFIDSFGFHSLYGKKFKVSIGFFNHLGVLYFSGKFSDLSANKGWLTNFVGRLDRSNPI